MAENINTVNHRWIRETFEHVNLAVDATCGGGNDTVFLAGLADNVLALDIQLEAVRKTQKKTAGFTNVTVIQADHAELARWLTQPAQIIVFNLGYLLFFKPADHDTRNNAAGTGRRCFPSDAGWLVGAGLLPRPCGRHGRMAGRCRLDRATRLSLERAFLYRWPAGCAGSVPPAPDLTVRKSMK